MQLIYKPFSFIPTKFSFLGLGHTCQATQINTSIHTLMTKQKFQRRRLKKRYNLKYLYKDKAVPFSRHSGKYQSVDFEAIYS
jgi:hypothetical protein